MMTNRIVVSIIGKFTDPNRPESVEYNPVKDPDFISKAAIILSEVVFYEEYITNPEHPYYQHKGPFTKVGMNCDYERIILMSFEEFDSTYQEAMKFNLTTKYN